MMDGEENILAEDSGLTQDEKDLLRMEAFLYAAAERMLNPVIIEGRIEMGDKKIWGNPGK